MNDCQQAAARRAKQLLSQVLRTCATNSIVPFQHEEGPLALYDKETGRLLAVVELTEEEEGL